MAQAASLSDIWRQAKAAATAGRSLTAFSLAVAILGAGSAGLAFNAPRPVFRNTSNDTASTGSVAAPAASNAEGAPAEPAATTSSGPPAPSTIGPEIPTGPIVTLKQALNEALINSPRASAVRSQLGITKAMYAAATELPNPSFTRDEAPIAEQARRVGVMTTYEPPWKAAFRLLVAKRQFKETKLEILSTLWGFRNDVRRAYTEVVVTKATYETLRELYDLSAKLLDVSQKRFQAGDVPELDALKARLATSQAQIMLAQGGRRVIRAKQLLSVILGSNVDRPLDTQPLPNYHLKVETSDLLPDFAKPLPTLRELIGRALANRLEMRIIKQQIAVNQAQLAGSIGNIIPNPSVGTGNSQAGNPPTGPKLNGFFVSLAIDLPVLSFNQGEITKLRATTRQLQRQSKSQENTITAEVTAAYNSLLAARGQIRSYQDHVLNDSMEVARLARRSYEVGQSDITSTLLAQQANVGVRSQYLDAVQAYQQAFTDLEQAVGEPLQY